jgi:hypothetical protein
MESLGGGHYQPARAVNIDEFLYLPVTAGLWRQHEIWDGTYSLEDLLDIHEVLAVKMENEHRAAAAAVKAGGNL